MATPNYNINYDDKRFAQVEADKKAELSKVEKTYGDMINQSDKYYQAQIDASKDWAEKQTQLQQEQTDFAIEKIEQQKDQAKKDYIKEQSGAYGDYIRQVDPYGVNAEQMAAQGLSNSGYSESAKVSMYNTYQNRYATAREVYNRAVLNYDNAIKEAQLQNNSILAEIAYKALQQQLELSLAGFQYKNQLLIEQSNKRLEVDNMYYNRYQDVLQQINTENTLKEQVRQYEQNYALQQKEYEEGVRQFNAEIALQQAQLEEEKRQFDATHSGGSGTSDSSNPSSSNSSDSSDESSKKISYDNVPKGLNKSVNPVSSYNGAVSAMKGYKVKSDVIGGLMTSEEWRRRRTSYNATGIGNEAVKNNSSYTEYLNDYVKYAINNK